MCSAHCDNTERKTCTGTGVITALIIISSRLVLPFSRDAPDAASGNALHPPRLLPPELEGTRKSRPLANLQLSEPTIHWNSTAHLTRSCFPYHGHLYTPQQ